MVSLTFCRLLFLSTPSARRATLPRFPLLLLFCDFYPRPPRGGRLRPQLAMPLLSLISIHALREEGDCRLRKRKDWSTHFYPRPPRGGRREWNWKHMDTAKFLSTPSARRATANLGEQAILKKISIHALREEGDVQHSGTRRPSLKFLSTPSARRATIPNRLLWEHWKISIHALREEGDEGRVAKREAVLKFLSTPSARRATSDPGVHIEIGGYFYPRPPRGGRHLKRAAGREIALFLSTPSARRATGQSWRSR